LGFGFWVLGLIRSQAGANHGYVVSASQSADWF